VTLRWEALPISHSVSNRNLTAYATALIQAGEGFSRARLTRCELHLPSLDLAIWFASDAFARLCRRLLIERPASQPVDHAEIFAMDTSLAGWSPPLRWDAKGGYSAREFEQRLAGAGLRGFYEHEGPSWQVFAPARRLGVQSLAEPMGLPPWEMGSPLRLFLHWAYAASGRRLTHAAAIGADGKGALIVGPSGAGKSGTALAALCHGLASAGDDYVLLEAGERVKANAVFRIMKQDRGGLQRGGVSHPLLDAAAPNWHGKIEFDPQAIGLPPLAPELDIGAILIPSIARVARTSIERASARDAALALAPSATLQLPGDTNEGFTFFTALAKRLPAFRLALSEEPAEIAGAIGEFLARGRHLAG
jgi:hypothetical protein